MPYYKQPGQEFTPVLLGAPAGVAAALGLRLLNAATGAEELRVVPGALSGVVEINAPSGNYRLPGVDVPEDTGEYLIQWDHGAVEIVDAEQLVILVGTVPVAAVDITPSLSEVGAMLRARTKDNAGNEVGTFNANTRPTGSQAESIIAQSVADLTMRVGDEVPDELKAAAKRCVALKAASEIERSYTPEQSTDTFSAFQSLRLSYEEAVKTLVHAVQIRDAFTETEAA